MTLHRFADASVLNPVTGKPHTPRWGEDWPDPRCVCGAPWLEGQCADLTTIAGACWELSELIHRLAEVLHPTGLMRAFVWLSIKYFAVLHWCAIRLARPLPRTKRRT